MTHLKSQFHIFMTYKRRHCLDSMHKTSFINQMVIIISYFSNVSLFQWRITVCSNLNLRRKAFFTTKNYHRDFVIPFPKFRPFPDFWHKFEADEMSETPVVVASSHIMVVTDPDLGRPLQKKNIYNVLIADGF